MKIGENDGIRRWQQAYGLRWLSTVDGCQPREPVDRSQDAIKKSESIKRDQVCLSPLGQELQKVRSAIEGQPRLREEKVAELRRLIASGEYSVPDQQLAEKIVDHFLGEQ